MKRTLALLSAILLCLSAKAGGKEFLRRLHPGLEWGYSLTAATFCHFNYLDPSIGFRINEKGWSSMAQSNAYVLASVGYNINDRLMLSLLSGYQGIDRGIHSVPILARADYYLSGMDTDGFYVFSDIGVNLGRPNSLGNQMQVGSGYSFYMAPHCSVAVVIGARAVYDRPDIWDPVEEAYIPKHNIKRNDAWYCAFNMGINLKF